MRFADSAAETLALVPSPSRHRAPRSGTTATGNTTGTTTAITTVDALDLAFAGAPCEFVQADGTSRVMAVHRWRGKASPADLNLFVDRCHGPTLDVGCGPGRLTAAVTERGFYALGIDISTEAVRQTRARGAAAVRQDVFAGLPGAMAWQHVLLADGNIGLRGDPVHLLRRVVELLAADGTVLVEVARPGVGTVHEQVRLRVGDQISPPFSWATVGVDSIEAVAAEGGLELAGLHHDSGRHVATLRPTEGRP
jgi:SAM-dependent methyltransferase